MSDETRLTIVESNALLAEAKRAIIEAEALPDIAKIVRRAEIVRYAAQISELGVVSVNSWTLLKVYAQIKGAAKIAEMRAAGELLEKGKYKRDKSISPPGGLMLSDLIGRRATQRSSEWWRLALLTKHEIDEQAAKANKAVKLLTEKELIKLGAGKLTKAKREASRGAVELPDACVLRIGDCRDELRDVPDNSVPLIMTDPPYGDEAEALYEWLAAFGARVLIPGGSLICYTGQARLDRDIQILSSRLRWWWLCIMPHHQSQRLPGKFVIAGFKPVLWYVKDHRRGRTLMPDMLKSPARDKDLHNWAQGEGGVSQVIEHLTEPGELIVDPFAGTGRWGRIAAEMGRRWLGCDVIEGGESKVIADKAEAA